MPLPVQMPDLSQMYGQQSVMPTIHGLEQLMMAKRMQEQNMAEQKQTMDFEAQKQPLSLADLQSQTNYRNAGIPLLGQQTEELRLKNEMTNSVPLEMRKKHAISKMAMEMDDNELKKNENEIRRILMNPNVEASMKQRLHTMLELFPEVHKERMRLDAQYKQSVDVANIHGETSRDVARIGADSRESVAKMRADAAKKSAVDMYDAAKAGKLSFERAAVALYFAATHEDDPQKKAQLLQMSNEMELADQKQKQAAAQAVPNVDPKRVPGAPLTEPKLPGPTLGVTNNTPKLSPQDQQALDWANANPNDPRAKKIKEKLGVK